ncbi:hypothetical protein GY45DRAFT_1436334 [Cubamyces sp. BRFM 1775]|nr:hypothetical protein GY45DRAFT_1436334 [Cubamyces sp. BRFM 1775]
MTSQLAEGWVYVDDDDYRIRFSNGWRVLRSISQAYDATMHPVANLEGATATFNFTGTAIAVYGAVGDVTDYGWPSSSYAIDGKVYETYNFVTAAGYSDVSQFRYQVPFFTVQDLPAGNHTLVITVLNGTSPNTYWLDYIRFFPFGNLTSSDPRSTTSAQGASINTSTPTAPTTTTAASVDNESSGSGSRSEGAVIGGAIGGGAILAIFLAAFATCFYMRRRKNRSSREFLCMGS